MTSSHPTPPQPGWVTPQGPGMHCVPTACEMLLRARLGVGRVYLDPGNYDPVHGAPFAIVAKDIQALSLGVVLAYDRHDPFMRPPAIRRLLAQGRIVATTYLSRICPTTGRHIGHAVVVAGAHGDAFHVVDGNGLNKLISPRDPIVTDPNWPEIAWLEP